MFCDYEGPSEVLGRMVTFDEQRVERDRFYVIEPIDPVTPGHVLVIPKEHVTDFRDEDADEIVEQTFGYAASWAAEHHPREGCNLIASAGVEATQTVMHLHVHVVPRREGDGLRLPWTP